MRQIVLDTETTGLEVEHNHRIIEIGCIELQNRRPTKNDFHRYLNPERDIQRRAEEVHGITSAFLADKPRFADVARELRDYLAGAELIIHNAAFDVGFLDMEFSRCGIGERLDRICTITDTVAMARRLNPGQKASLDALCRRYSVDNSRRDYHGALLDARLLADVYLAMTGGQSKLGLDAADGAGARASRFAELLGASENPLPVILASSEELAAHHARLAKIATKGACLWADELQPWAHPEPVIPSTGSGQALGAAEDLLTPPPPVPVREDPSLRSG